MPRKKTSRRRTRKLRALPSLLTAVLIAFCFCVYIPAISYLSNVNFYSFSLEQLLLGLLFQFICVAVGLSILLLTVSHLQKAVWRKSIYVSPKRKSLVSVFHILLLLVALCIWLEGSPLSRGLPELTGEGNIFTDQLRLIWDSVMWGVVLLLGFIFWRVGAKNFGYLFVGVCLLLGLGMADAVMNQEPRTATENNTTANEVLDRAAFNPEDNVLIMVLDATSTAVVQDYLAVSPGASAALDGFVLFENNMESATSTQWSLPSIMKGDIFTGGSALEYQNSLYDAPESLAQKFNAEGYDIFASSTLPSFNRYIISGQDIKSAEVDAIQVPDDLYNQFLVRFAPYALKNAVNNRAGIYGNVQTTTALPGGNLEALKGLQPVNQDEITYRALIGASDKRDSATPTFHFHHVNGAHMPYTVDSQGRPLPAQERVSLKGLKEQSSWTLQYVLELLQALKDNDLYDTTTIVLMGDHGDRLSDDSRENNAYAIRASLLIKPKGQRGALKKSAAPMSNMYLSELLPVLHREALDLALLTSVLPEERRVLRSNSQIAVYRGDDVTKLSLVDLIPVEQEFEATALQKGTRYALTMLADNPNIAFPLSFENGNFNNGWGLRVLGENMECSFRADAEPGEFVDVTVRVATSLLVGGSSEFVPYDLTLRDKVSGRATTVRISTGREDIYLNGAQVSEEKAIELEVSLSKHPGPDTLQVSATQILIEDMAVKKEEEATRLEDGVRYALNAKREGAITARPLHYMNADFMEGGGLYALEGEMECAFAVNRAPRQKVNIALTLAALTPSGEPGDFAPYDVTIRDMESGQESAWTIDGNDVEIPLQNVVVSGESSIRLAFSFTKLPSPEVSRIALAEIQIENPLSQPGAPTPMALGTRYALSAEGEEDIVVYPMRYEGAEQVEGAGLRATANEMECVFLVNSSPKEPVDVTLVITAPVQIKTEVEPDQLTVVDLVSGRRHSYALDAKKMEVTLEGVSIAEDFTIRFELSQTLNAQPVQITLSEIQVDK